MRNLIVDYLQLKFQLSDFFLENLNVQILLPHDPAGLQGWNQIQINLGVFLANWESPGSGTSEKPFNFMKLLRF